MTNPVRRERGLGRAHPGVLPAGYRVASAGGAAAWLGLAALLGTDRLSGRRGRRVLEALVALMGVAVLLNAIPPSRVERLIWTPVALAQLVLLWRVRRSRSTGPSSASALERRG